MSNRIKQFSVGCVLACVAILMGCEYQGTGDSGSWNSSASWVNFSGVYRAGGGGVLVSDFTIDTGGGSSENGTNSIDVSNEVIGQGNGVATVFSGTLAHGSILPGSLEINGGAFTLVDQGNGSLVGNLGSFGSVTYGTGAWSFNLNGIPLANGDNIIASYSYTVSSGGGGGGSGGGGQGSSGAPIVTFTVFQAGNKIEITDNNGAKYNGQLGNVATTSGINSDSDTTLVPSIGDSVIAEYTADGTSSAGKHVMLAGTFQGVVGRGSETAMFLNDRRMLGTWIESGGVTGDINGQASPVAISVSTTTPTP